ncbi:hypothetical protein [Bartonella birtlesii]|nr:hypothetical protein [Bartonella birtlesii]
MPPLHEGIGGGQLGGAGEFSGKVRGESDIMVRREEHSIGNVGMG